MLGSNPSGGGGYCHGGVWHHKIIWMGIFLWWADNVCKLDFSNWEISRFPKWTNGDNDHGMADTIVKHMEKCGSVWAGERWMVGRVWVVWEVGGPGTEQANLDDTYIVVEKKNLCRIYKGDKRVQIHCLKVFCFFLNKKCLCLMSIQSGEKIEPSPSPSGCGTRSRRKFK